MAIKLDIALEQLAAPGIAEALARLVGALADPAAAAAPTTKARAATPKKAAPAVVEAVPDAAERYRRFVAGLPERSRRFIEMVRTHELLKISDAMRALGLTAPKAMGGLTGSIGRWAPNRGVKVPYETTTADGERAWRWIGSPIDDATDTTPMRASDTPTMLPAARPPVISAPPAEQPVEPAAPATRAQTKPAKPAALKAEAKTPTPPAAKAPAAKPAPKKAAPKKAAPKKAAPEKAAPEKAAPAPVADDAPRKMPDWRDFEDLPEKSQQFLTLVASRGLVTREEALEELGLRRPKELGGVTEPIVRRSREKDIDRPYLAGKRDGKRVWIWATHAVPDDVEVS